MTRPFDTADQDRGFRRLAASLVAATLVLALIIPWVPVPEIDREQQEELPPRLAEIILEKREPEPPPPPPPEREPEEIVKTEPEPPPEPEPEVERAPVPQTVKQAREKAKSSGILAFRDQLSALRDTVDVSTLEDTSAIQRDSGEAAQLDRSLLTAENGPRLANVDTSTLTRDIGGIAVASHETTKVDAPEEEVASTGARRLIREPRDSVRSIEEIRRVFDANKGAIYAIYNRALRRDPSLLGKVVLELVIEPSGQVSVCEVVSSDLPDEDMMAKIVRRVQLFDFGEKEVGVTRISYPVHFLPS